MFTLDDIKVLTKVEGAAAVLVYERGAEIPEDLKKEFEKQIKKATKLPVIFVPNGVGEVKYG